MVKVGLRPLDPTQTHFTEVFAAWQDSAIENEAKTAQMVVRVEVHEPVPKAAATNKVRRKVQEVPAEANEELCKP
jgi:hypothetical protein